MTNLEKLNELVETAIVHDEHEARNYDEDLEYLYFESCDLVKAYKKASDDKAREDILEEAGELYDYMEEEMTAFSGRMS